MPEQTLLHVVGGLLLDETATLAHDLIHAIAEADSQGIIGKSVTPWLLGRIVELSDGTSLATNSPFHE